MQLQEKKYQKNYQKWCKMIEKIQENIHKTHGKPRDLNKSTLSWFQL